MVVGFVLRLRQCSEHINFLSCCKLQQRPSLSERSAACTAIECETDFQCCCTALLTDAITLGQSSCLSHVCGLIKHVATVTRYCNEIFNSRLFRKVPL